MICWLHNVWLGQLNGLWTRTLIAFTVSCSISAGNSTAASAQTGVKGWLLTQNHSANGTQHVYVFPMRLRIENIDLGNTVIADAQTGRVWVFNDSRKILCSVTWDRFEHSFSKIMSVGGESIAKLKWAKASDPKKTVIAGLSTNCYKAYDEKLYFKGGGGGFVSGGSRMIDVEHTMYLASKIKTSPRLVKVFSEMQTAPTLDGVPLKQTSFFRQHSKLKVFLDTLAAKEVGDDKKFWTIPKYKQVPTVADVTNVTDRGFLEDVMGK
jgi:hypothetical protein